VDAERFASGREVAKAVGDIVNVTAGTMRLRDWYEECLAEDDLAPSTAAKWAGVWRLYVEPALGFHALARITRDDVQRMVTKARQRSPWQAGEALKLTRRLLNRAVDAERISRNPAARIEMPRTERTKPKVLTPGEIVAVMEKLPERWRVLIMLDAYTSLRWSEVVALRRDDIDLEARTVRVDEKLVEVGGRFVWGTPKTAGSARVVDMPDLLIKPLAEHLLRFPPLRTAELAGLVFYGERGGPVRRHVFRRDWYEACDAAGVGRVRLEWLRHTGASLAYAATRDMKAVAARLGHTSTRMMDQVYVQLYDEQSRNVADAIDELAKRSLNR
jgi:integrase